MEDNELVRELYGRNFPVVLNYVKNNNGNREHAEDIYHDAFLAVWRNIQLDKFKPENESSFNTYLLRVAKNKWIDYLRSKGFKMTVDLTDDYHPEENHNEDEAEINNYISEVKKHFKNLGDNCKDLLTKFYYKKFSMRQIAAHFGWSEATARNNKYRCIQKLRDLINNDKH